MLTLKNIIKKSFFFDLKVVFGEKIWPKKIFSANIMMIENLVDAYINFDRHQAECANKKFQHIHIIFSFKKVLYLKLFLQIELQVNSDLVKCICQSVNILFPP